MLRAVIADILGIANIVTDIMDIAIDIADVATDIADIATDIADIAADILDIADIVNIRILRWRQVGAYKVLLGCQLSICSPIHRY